MKEFKYLDNAKKIVEYDEEMGEIKNFKDLKVALVDKSIEEQKKHFYLSWSAPRFATTYTLLYETDKPVIIKDNIIVGVVLEGSNFLLVGTGYTDEERSDNNGAGYKEYSELTLFKFTRVALDKKGCRYADYQEENDFFVVHKYLEEVLIDETVDYIGAEEVNCKVKYVGSINHWLNLNGFKNELKEVHLYLNGYKEETTSVVIPDDVENISRDAFYNCVGLKEVILPKYLITIQPDAFHGCTSLEKIYLPDTVHDIHADSFRRCTSLREIRFPRGAFLVGRCAFSKCTALKEVYIPSSCEYMSERIFGFCDENLKIRCAASKKLVYEEWSKSWNMRDNDRDGSYYYDIEWAE